MARRNFARNQQNGVHCSPGYKTASNSRVVLVEATYSGLLRTRVRSEGARRDSIVYLLLPYARSQRLCALQYCIRRTFEKNEISKLSKGRTDSLCADAASVSMGVLDRHPRDRPHSKPPGPVRSDCGTCTAIKPVHHSQLV